MNFETNRNEYLSSNVNYNLVTSIPVFDSCEFSYNDFMERFMFPNIPCIIHNITNKWESHRLWVKDGKPNFDYLSKKYGQSIVTIYNCSERYYNSQKTHESTFVEYLNYWRYCMVDDGVLSLDYLKDWHLKLNNEYDNFYEVPIYFASDWLNEYYKECLNDDYRFVYMGPKGTWTPFHADVFTSFSWSVNVCGRKRWLFFPPGEEEFLKDALGNLPYDVTKLTHSRKCFDIVQNSGEAIFVPSGWHHQVWNLEDTISINHNWINSCNIMTMWTAMINNLKLIRKEIDDCKDMEDFDEHCQIMLNASFGMNFYKFFDFIKFIAISRIDILKGNKSRVLFHGHTIGQHHIIVDLQAIKTILETFASCDDVNSLSYFKNEEINNLLQKILNIL